MVGGSWISTLLNGIWWVILLGLGNLVLVLIISEYRLRKKDTYRRMTYNPKYAKRLGIDERATAKNSMPSSDLFELFQMVKKAVPKYEVTLRQYHMTLSQNGCMDYVLTIDDTLDADNKDIGGVIWLNFTQMPNKAELRQRLQAVYQADKRDDTRKVTQTTRHEPTA